MARSLRKRPCRSRSPFIDDSLFVGTIDDRVRAILRRVWQRPFVLEHLVEITAIDPAIARRVT